MALSAMRRLGLGKGKKIDDLGSRPEGTRTISRNEGKFQIDRTARQSIFAQISR